MYPVYLSTVCEILNHQQKRVHHEHTPRFWSIWIVRCLLHSSCQWPQGAHPTLSREELDRIYCAAKSSIKWCQNFVMDWSRDGRKQFSPLRCIDDPLWSQILQDGLMAAKTVWRVGGAQMVSKQSRGAQVPKSMTDFRFRARVSIQIKYSGWKRVLWMEKI